MAEEHKVPKGVLESATMKYGITLDQFFILSFVSVLLTFVIFFSGKYTVYVLLFSIVAVGSLYMLMRTSNYFHKNAFQEYFMYFIRRNRVPKRYSGRCRY